MNKAEILKQVQGDLGERRGFTLVELIIVIAIIAILAGAIFVAIDPARRLHETRNARRSADIATILDGVKKFQADNSGTHYSTIASLTVGQYYQIGTDAVGCGVECGSETTQNNCVNLAGMGTNYLAVVPFDPKNGTAAQSAYGLMKDANGAVTILVCETEGEGPGGGGTPPTISITR